MDGEVLGESVGPILGVRVGPMDGEALGVEVGTILGVRVGLELGL